ncbi:hypothetical protein P3T36_000555 [Kitasatospora sp. MAP12-15]
MRRAFLRPRAVGVGAVALLTLFTAGCSADPAGVPARMGTPGPSAAGGIVVPPVGSTPGGGELAPTDGPQGADGRVVLRAYQAWWAAQVQADARSDSTGAQLRIYSTGAALSGVLASLHGLHEAKLVMSGAPVNSPKVATLDPGSDPQNATIVDCVDVSGWHQADAADGSIKDPPQRLQRYVASAAMRLNGTTWMVVDFNREAGRTC